MQYTFDPKKLFLHSVVSCKVFSPESLCASPSPLFQVVPPLEWLRVWHGKLQQNRKSIELTFCSAKTSFVLRVGRPEIFELCKFWYVLTWSTSPWLTCWSKRNIHQIYAFQITQHCPLLKTYHNTFSKRTWKYVLKSTFWDVKSYKPLFRVD